VQLTTYDAQGDSIRAGYACPCGCAPSTTYQRGGEVSVEGCCCGNEFAVGHEAEKQLKPRAGFELQTTNLTAPWGESITAAWMIGDSVHPEPEGHAHDHDHEHGQDGKTDGTTVIDPVCGMSVEPATALEKGLHAKHEGKDYYFCGKGCKLDFGEDPARYLDPSYVPSM
jgi:YHS domain-containing protein